ncbi:MAG: hypothetical protein II863_14405, partial [Kiritimatiellae bacterium]|nr:hypothetical protein [Kiritimatiellia bacterium]
MLTNYDWLSPFLGRFPIDFEQTICYIFSRAVNSLPDAGTTASCICEDALAKLNKLFRAYKALFLRLLQ